MELRVVRFRKRHYMVSPYDNPWPYCLGLEVLENIATDAAEYEEWLAAQRKSAEEWDLVYEQILSVKPGSEVKDLRDLMLIPVPSPFAQLNMEGLEWILIVDLDREIFSVNNKYHFKLEQLPHIKWLHANGDVNLEDQVSLPDPVPMEGGADSVIEHPSQSGERSDALNMINVNDVSLLFVTAYV